MAEYGHSGIMTFMVNHQGKVFEKELGPDTAQVAAAIDAYDPELDLDPSHRATRRAAGGDVIEAACPPAIMNREARFYRALGETRGYRSGRAAGLPRWLPGVRRARER